MSRPVPVVRVYTRLETGGVEEQLLRVLPRLEARGRYRTRLILTRRAGGMLDEYRRAGLDVRVVPQRGRSHPRNLRQLAAEFREFGAGLVHAHTWSPSMTATGAALLAGRLPVIASIHNIGTIQGWRRILQERIWNRFRGAVVCVSEAVRQDYLREVGADPDKVSVLYNGIDVAAMRSVPADRHGVRRELGLDPDAELVVCVARLTPQKEHAALIEAFSRVAAARPRARLLIVGTGPLEREVTARARHEDVRGRVLVTGERGDVPRLLRSADLATLASSREGFSNVVLECLAAGLPLVATDVGGNREAMGDEEAGLIVPPGDTAALAAALSRMLDDADLRRRAADGAARRAERFDLERTVDATEALYDRLLGKAGAGS